MSLEKKAKELSAYFRIVKETSHGIDKNNPAVCSVLNSQEAQILLRTGSQGPTTMSQFAQSLQLSLGGVTPIVDKLEDKKLIVRKRSQKDRRIVYVALTKKGRDFHDLVQEGHLKLTRRILRALSRRQQDQLLHLFQKISSSLQKKQPKKI